MTTTEPSRDLTPRVQVIVDADPVVEGGGVIIGGAPERPDPLPPAPPGGRDPVLSFVALIVVLALVVIVVSAVGADRQSATVRDASDRPTAAEQGDTTSSIDPDEGPRAGSTDETPTTGDLLGDTASDPVTSGRVGEFVPWPEPPEDHDPHMLGRPMPAGFTLDRPPGAGGSSGSPSSVALMYVNHIGRPTILDLSFGHQSELIISPTRIIDHFLVEGGRIVVDDDNERSPLDPAGDRAVGVQVVRVPPAEIDSPRLVERPAPVRLIGPNLCLDAEGCPGLRWTTGRFGDDADSIESLQGPPVEALSNFFGAIDVQVEQRVTVLFLAADSSSGYVDVDQITVPTPLESTTVWLITQR